MKKQSEKGCYRIFIQIRDKSRKDRIDEYGRTIIPIKWIEVPKINLGSIKKKRPEILQVKIEWHDYEKEKPKPDDILKKLFGGE